ncbi:MAG: PAS domain-containing protein [Anaerolineales bacterium]|nr:PAS domain-containing protein [Chloroflexota bacterium]MBL6980184.1 PAS domain-containing protein [Anaerolineales bacterium]
MKLTKTKKRGYWSIRWKTIFLLTIAFTAIFVSIFYWFYRISINIALDDLHEDLTAISNTAAAGLDGDVHQALYENADYDDSLEWPKGMADERYWEMSEWLYLVHQSNPRALLYTYISPEPGKVEFVVSMGPLMDPIIGAEFRAPYWPQPPSVILNGLVEETLSTNVVVDQWGSWVSGFTPLYNSRGEINAAVGVDYRADNITIIKNKITNAAIPAFIISYLFMLIFIVYISNRTVEPVISLSKAATQIGEGKLAKVIHPPGLFKDEISKLTDVFNSMAEKIQVRREHTIALYRDNIQRHEQERMKLAHDLHDEVLNGLAALSMAIDDQHVSPKFHQVYEKLTFRIRRIINGLRPPMLDHGLNPALEALVDELLDRSLGDISIILEIDDSIERHESSVEGHLFRIVQQACENAFQHANAKTIRISGALKKDNIELIVEDDGVGFVKDKILSRPHNSDRRHFGLVMMQERAEIINADLVIESTLGEGTRIEIVLSDVLLKQWEYRARIQAEAALRENELTARSLMNETFDVIFIIDCDGIILDANNALAKEFNIPVDELVGSCVWDLLPPEIVEQRMPFMDQVTSSGRPIRFEDERSERWFDNYLYPIAENDGSITKVAIFSRDLTLRRLLEESLKESFEESKLILNATTDFIALTNIDGIILKTNEAMANRFESSIDDLVGRRVWDLFPPDVTDRRKKYGEKVIQSGESIQFQDSNQDQWFNITLYPIKDAEKNVVKFAVFVREINKEE